MKVLHVIETLGVGGAERLLATLLPELRRRGDEVAVAVLRPPLALAGALEAEGVAVVVLPARHRWNLPALARDIARCARARQADVVHAHLYFPAIGTALGRILRLHAAATVVTFHNLAYAPGVNPPGLRLRLRKALAALLYPHGFDAMLAVSQAVADHYRVALGLAQVAVLHDAVDLRAIAAVPAARPRQAASVLVVLPGRLVPEKGHTDMLGALQELRRAGRLVQLAFAGGGPLQPHLESEILRRGLATWASITGFLPHARLLELVAEADVVVTPSRAEGFGLTAVEAMALGRPVVACAVGGLAEVLEDGRSGLLVPPASPPALAAAIGRLLDDPLLRRRLGHAARARAETMFGAPAVAERLRAIYAGLAGAPARAAVAPQGKPLP